LRCGGRRPGTDISFVDSSTGERFLQVATSEQGQILIAYTLYDSSGRLVADSDGPQAFVEGKEVRDDNNELLLLIPLLEENHIQYRLHNDKGVLVTCSDGARTQLFGGIRLESTKVAPSSFKKVVASPSGRIAEPTEATLASPQAIRSTPEGQANPVA
jgi:hypothetical protein